MTTLEDQALHESMQELYEQAPCGYILMLPDGRITRVNQTLVTWTGRSRSQLVESTRFQDLLTIPGKIFYENQYAPLLRLQGFVQGVAFDLVCQTREPLPVLVSSVQRLGRDGRPALTASILLDATDRRAYERELLLRRAEAEQLAAIVTASSDAILTASASGEVLTWNAGAARLMGLAPGDIVGHNVREILPNFDVYDETAGPADQQPGQAIHVETTALHATGHPIDVSVGVTPHLGPLGELRSLSLIVRDVSERRALERMQQEFLAMASHELRNPVATIKGYAQLMRRRARYHERSLDAIVAHADQLDGLINDLMLASQIEADRLELHATTLDLVTEARTAAEQNREQGYNIRFQSDDDCVPVSIDRQRLAQVFANLLTNAIKYSPGGSEVLMRVSRHADEALVAIIDQGVGISADALPHVFDRFFRAEASARQVQGLGLGLFITRRIVEAHGGAISVSSEVGRGSTFTVKLPVSIDA
jgi:PAS domain S-box-containing protein